VLCGLVGQSFASIDMAVYLFLGLLSTCVGAHASRVFEAIHSPNFQRHLSYRNKPERTLKFSSGYLSFLDDSLFPRRTPQIPKRNMYINSQERQSVNLLLSILGSSNLSRFDSKCLHRCIYCKADEHLLLLLSLSLLGPRSQE